MTYANLLKTIKFCAIALLVLLAFSVYLKKSFYIGWDMGQYIANATSFLNDRGFVNFAHNPQNLRAGYVLFLALILGITGGSLKAVMFTIVGYSSSLALSIFIVTRQLSNWRTAFFVAVIWILTPTLIYQIPRLLDSLWPLLFLVAVWALLWVETKPKQALWLGSVTGLMLCGVVLIKASVLTLTALPLLYIFLVPIAMKYRFQFLLSCYAVLIVTVLVFEHYFLNISAEAGLANNAFTYPLNLLHDPSLSNMIAFVKAVCMGIYGYFFKSTYARNIVDIPLLQNRPISEYIPLIAFMLLSLVYTTVFALRRNKRWLILTLIFILCLPHICIAGLYSLRVTQNILVIALLYIAFGLCINDVLTRFFSTASKEERVFNLPNIMLVMMAILFLGSSFVYSPEAFKQRFFRHLWILQANKPIRIDLRGSLLARALPHYQQDDYQVIVQDAVIAKGLYIASSAIKPVNILPYRLLGWYQPNDTFYVGLSRDKSNILVINYSELKKLMEEKKVKYIVLTNMVELIDWFKHFNGVTLFKVIKQNNMTYTVFEVNQNWPELLTTPVVITEQARLFASTLQKDNPERYQWYQQKHGALMALL